MNRQPIDGPMRDKYGRFISKEFEQWYLQYKPDGSKYRVGYFDIEFTDLAANFGFVTCWSIKPRGSKKIVTHSITQKDILSGKFDKVIMEKFLVEMDNYDLLVGYYSSCADLPYLRARCLANGLGFVPYKTKNHLDLYFALRGKVAIRGKSLKNMTNFLGITGKVDLTNDEWFSAKVANPKVMKKLISRNQYDCIILEELHKKYENLVAFNRNWM